MDRVIKIFTLVTIAALPLYVVRFSVGPLPTTLLEILLITTVFAWAIGKWTQQKSLVLPPKRLNTIIALFLAAATIGIVVAPETLPALGLWRAYFIEPVLFFFVIFDLLKSKKLFPREIIASLAASALVVSVYAIFQRFTGWGVPHPWNNERRVTSLFPFPNAVGLYLAPLIPFFISRIIVEKKWVRMFYGIPTLSSLVAIWFAHSMGALVGLAGGLGIVAIVYFVHTKQWKVLAGFLLAATIAVSLIFSHASLRNELLLRDWSGRVRKIGWQESIQMLKSRPLFGAGLSGFPTALKPYHQATFLEIFQYPHNMFLNFWSETGLLGVFSFFGLILYFYIHTFKTLRTNPLALPAIGAMTVILIHGLVDVPYLKNDLAIIFWLMYALALETS